MSLIQGFRCIDVRFNDKCKAGHILYFKEHAIRNSHPSKPVGKTLFILNVPPYCTEDSIKELFSAAGVIHTVNFQEKPSGTKEVHDGDSFFSKNVVEGFKVAYVVFRKEASVKKAMTMEFGGKYFSSDEKPIKTGMAKWIQDYASSFIESKDLQQEIDRYMSQFDQKKQIEEEEMRNKEGQADEDGWITVTKHSKHAARTETMEKKVLEKVKRKEKGRKLINFYSFQMRETKMEHLADLRKKFEEDKKRIAAMKASRKFKPY